MILVIIYVENFKTDATDFIGYIIMFLFDVTQTDNFQNKSQFVVHDNNTQRDQTENFHITDNSKYP